MTPTGRDVPGAPVTTDSGHRLSCRSQLPKLRYVRDAERRQDASHRRCLHDRRCSWPIRPCGCPGRVGRESSTSQPGEWYLLDLAGNTTRLFYCSPGDLPIVGDRDHDGDGTPGLYWRSDGSIYLRNSNRVSPTSGSYLATPVTPLSPVTWTATAAHLSAIGVAVAIKELGANDGGARTYRLRLCVRNPGGHPFVGDFDDDRIDEVGLPSGLPVAGDFGDPGRRGHATTGMPGVPAAAPIQSPSATATVD